MNLVFLKAKAINLIYKVRIFLDTSSYVDKYGRTGGDSDGDKVLSSITNPIYNLFMTVSLIGLAISVLVGAIVIITNADNPRGLAEGKSRILNTIGLIIVTFAIIPIISIIVNAIGSVGLK